MKKRGRKKRTPKLGKAASKTKRSFGPLRDGMYVHYSDVRESIATSSKPRLVKERP